MGSSAGQPDVITARDILDMIHAQRHDGRRWVANDAAWRLLCDFCKEMTLMMGGTTHLDWYEAWAHGRWMLVCGVVVDRVEDGCVEPTVRIQRQRQST